MKDLNEMYLDVLARDLAPMPWVLDQCNEKGVCVKDSRGEDLYFEDFGGIPDEMSIGQREHIVERAKLFAQWLVAFSNDRVGAITHEFSGGRFLPVRWNDVLAVF